MKSVKMFGKSIPILAIVAIVMTAGMGGAYLVDYLSNTVKADITVVSPMVVGVSEGKPSWATTQCWRPGVGLVDSFPESDISDIHDWDEGDWTDSITISDIRGGETVTLYTRSVNLADAVIIGFEEAIVTNWAGVTSADFVSVVVRVDSIYGDLGYGTEHDLIALGAGVGYEETDDDHIRFGTAGTSTWGVGETDVTEIVVTFEEAAFGTYTFAYRIVPA
ncbi:hypothetical protein ES703_58676 [subsurface metagenome]